MKPYLLIVVIGVLGCSSGSSPGPGPGTPASAPPIPNTPKAVAEAMIAHDLELTAVLRRINSDAAFDAEVGNLERIAPIEPLRAKLVSFNLPEAEMELLGGDYARRSRELDQAQGAAFSKLSERPAPGSPGGRKQRFNEIMTRAGYAERASTTIGK